jgi:hypothetical protein
MYDFEVVPVAPVIIGITSVIAFHMHCTATVRSLHYYYYYYYPNFSLLSFSWEIFTYPGMYHKQD